MSGITVVSLFIYPVKSCKAVPLQEATLNEFGFEFDRFWMIVKADNSREMVTQRTEPTLALVAPRLEVNPGPAEVGAYQRGGQLILSAPGKPEISVPFRKSFDGVATFKTSVWKPDNVECVDEGDDVAQWLSDYLGKPVRLVVKYPHSVRPTSLRHTPEPSHFEHTVQTAFADGYPLLLCTTSSLEALNVRLKEKELDPVTIVRFRPNVVVQGPPAHDEDEWKRIEIASHPFFVSSRCTRCIMPSNDPETGRLGSEPTKTLMGYRRVDPGAKYEACFGMNLIHGKTGVAVRVGDSLLVTERTTQHNRATGLWQKDPVAEKKAADKARGPAKKRDHSENPRKPRKRSAMDLIAIGVSGAALVAAVGVVLAVAFARAK
ncbi:uncharacterized protein BJ171DRAFT_538048 [Polychytrium aggregatum]|uniref:uncharacterized protein n=1 Tax=Polychytrium aggregatum TaxID=110093 RepID=UPI0022FF1B7B|nr:uncharacterized protein BJ171DRAFT_538048 [Polychytrium aggregatum]KAI9192919.1 hypothetical protein BJ171DRAFT_538048 [Polychytrium aggregatum]